LSQAMHPQGWLPQQKVFSFSAYISNKLSKSVGIPSHRHGQTQRLNGLQYSNPVWSLHCVGSAHLTRFS
jgi:hypothetical protein